MKKYRIKKEAVPFILEKHATNIYTLDIWESIGIDIKALEEVEPVHLSYGIETSERVKTLGGWSVKDGAKFSFTIHYPSMKYREHDKFSKGRKIRDLMNTIQNEINYFYEQFMNEKQDKNQI